MCPCRARCCSNRSHHSCHVTASTPAGGSSASIAAAVLCGDAPRSASASAGLRPGPGGEVEERLLGADRRAVEPDQERDRGRVARPADEPLVVPRERRLAGHRLRDDRLDRGVVGRSRVEQLHRAVEQLGVRHPLHRPGRGALDGPDVLRVRPLAPAVAQADPAAPHQLAERRTRRPRHPGHAAAAVAVVGVAVDGRQREVAVADDVVAAQQLAHQGLQRPGDRPVDQLGEQRRQRVGQLLDDARPHVERRAGRAPTSRRAGAPPARAAP